MEIHLAMSYRKNEKRTRMFDVQKYIKKISML